MSIGCLPWNQPAAVVDRVCVRDGEVELTYGEVATRVDAVAEQFAALGVGRGDVVAWCCRCSTSNDRTDFPLLAVVLLVVAAMSATLLRWGQATGMVVAASRAAWRSAPWRHQLCRQELAAQGLVRRW